MPRRCAADSPRRPYQRSIRTIALLGVLLACVPARGMAQPLCYRPTEPSCARYLMPSSDTWEFEHCRSLLVRFQSEVQEYLACMSRERDAILAELEYSIRRFNQCARDRFC